MGKAGDGQAGMGSTLLSAWQGEGLQAGKSTAAITTTCPQPCHSLRQFLPGEYYHP